jgi:DNA-binding response OmpR family regulator
MTQAIRADTRWQHLPVIATSASVFNEDRERSMQAGCDDFLAKPIKPKVLFLMLERYLNITWRYTTIPAKSDKRLANNTDATQTNHPQTNHPQTNHSQQATSVPNDAALRRDDTDLEPDHINQDNVPNNDDGSANTDSTRTIN